MSYARDILASRTFLSRPAHASPTFLFEIVYARRTRRSVYPRQENRLERADRSIETARRVVVAR